MDGSLITRRIESYSNGSKFVFGVLLDDTETPGKPVMLDEAEAFVVSNKLIPCVRIFETMLAPLAFSVLLHIPTCHLHIEKRRLWYQDQDKSEPFVLFRHIDRSCRQRTVEEFLASLRDNMTSPQTQSGLLPTCPLYTAAWYLFRLMTSIEHWHDLANQGIDGAKNHALQLAIYLREHPPTMLAVLATFLQEFLKPNEVKVGRVLRHILHEPLPRPFEELITYEWY